MNLPSLPQVPFPEDIQGHPAIEQFVLYRDDEEYVLYGNDGFHIRSFSEESTAFEWVRLSIFSDDHWDCFLEFGCWFVTEIQIKPETLVNEIAKHLPGFNVEELTDIPGDVFEALKGESIFGWGIKSIDSTSVSPTVTLRVNMNERKVLPTETEKRGAAIALCQKLVSAVVEYSNLE